MADTWLRCPDQDGASVTNEPKEVRRMPQLAIVEKALLPRNMSFVLGLIGLVVAFVANRLDASCSSRCQIGRRE